MSMRLAAFADLLRVKPSELLHALHTDGTLDGMTLPAALQVKGAALMFASAEAKKFAAAWHERSKETSGDVTAGPLMSLSEIARGAGIAPLALWLAISQGKRLCGIRPPPAVKRGKQMLFCPVAAAEFIRKYRTSQQIS